MAREYTVGNTTYSFPDDFTDEKVTGILTQQGVIGPKANAGARPMGSLPRDEARTEPKGFLGTLGHDLKYGPTDALESISTHGPLGVLRNIADARDAVFRRADEQAARGNLMTGLGMRVASLIPFLGPAASNVIEDLGGTGGDPGRGAARALELVGPQLLMDGLPSLAGASRIGPVARGMGSEIKAAAPAIREGGLTGELMGLPFGHTGATVGGAIGAGVPAAQAVVRGAKKGWKAGAPIEMPANPRSAQPPVWADLPEPAAPLPPDLTPIKSSGLPSGRMPGKPGALPGTSPVQPVRQQAAAAPAPPATMPAAAPIEPIRVPFQVKPGEGSHLDLSDLQPGNLPTKQDYAAQARKLWAGHMQRAMQAKGITSDRFLQMNQADVDALAKEIGLAASSPEKLKILAEKLGGLGK